MQLAIYVFLVYQHFVFVPNPWFQKINRLIVAKNLHNNILALMGMEGVGWGFAVTDHHFGFVSIL